MLDPPNYPIEILKRIYITPFGGFSNCVRNGSIGINYLSIQKIPVLYPGKYITIGKFDNKSRVPYVFKYRFKIVPIVPTMEDFDKSIGGQVLLPHEIPNTKSESERLDLSIGDTLIINAVI